MSLMAGMFRIPKLLLARCSCLSAASAAQSSKSCVPKNKASTIFKLPSTTKMSAPEVPLLPP